MGAAATTFFWKHTHIHTHTHTHKNLHWKPPTKIKHTTLPDFFLGGGLEDFSTSLIISLLYNIIFGNKKQTHVVVLSIWTISEKNEPKNKERKVSRGIYL